MPDRDIPSIHGPDHVPGGPDPIPPYGTALFSIRLYEDDEVVESKTWTFAIPEDLDGASLVKAEAWVTTPSSSGTVVVGIAGLLDDPLVIEVGEGNTKDATVPPLALAGNVVAWGDEVTLDITNAGTGAKGLGVHLYFLPLEIAAVIIHGAKGDPGGVSDFQGNWSTSTSYPAGSVVVHDGVVYLSTADHTSGATTEPGTGVDWETVWSSVISIPLTASVNATITNATGAIPAGLKGAYPFPFDGTITSARLLADVAGDATVDLWVTDFSGYPPSSGDSITGAAPLTLVGSIKNEDLTLPGWTTAVAEGDILVPYVSGVTAIQRLTVNVIVEKTT